jgi:GT2 family glycosyltransferase
MAFNATSGPVETSVILVSYNSRTDLLRGLPGVLATLGPTDEVIVVDNASTDGSAAAVAAGFPQVRLLCNATNAGFAAAHNAGAAVARGRYLVGLNPDTVVTAGWLAALIAPLRGPATGRPVGLTTARILRLEPAGRINTCGNTMHYTGLTVCRGLDRPAAARELAQPCDVPAVSGACFATTQALWQALGGFDGDFFTYLEDTDLSLRAALAGYACRYVPAAVVYHRYTGQFGARKFYHLERNRWLMLLKSYQARTLGLLLPALALSEAITWGYALLGGRPLIGAKIASYAWLLTHGPLIRQKRRQTQTARRVGDQAALAGMAGQLDCHAVPPSGLAQAALRLVNPLFAGWYHVARAWVRVEA